MRATAFMLAALGSACAPDDLSLELPLGQNSAILIARSSADLAITAFAVPDDAAYRVSLAESTEELWLLAYPLSLVEMSIPSGPISLSSGPDGRALPSPDLSFELRDGRLTELSPANLPTSVLGLRLRLQSAFEICSGSGGCLTRESVCESPCRVAELRAPTPPDPVDMRPCPVGWVESARREATICLPYPSEVPECPAGTISTPSAPECQPMGPCGRWPSEAPPNALYVDATAPAGGSGAIDAPFRTLAEAAALSRSATIALAEGSYEVPVGGFSDLTIRGACTERVVVSAPPGAPVFDNFDNLHVADLTVLSSGHGGVLDHPGSTSTLRNVALMSTGETDTLWSIEDASATATRVRISGGRSGLVARGAHLLVRGLQVEGTKDAAIRVESGSIASLTDFLARRAGGPVLEARSSSVSILAGFVDESPVGPILSGSDIEIDHLALRGSGLTSEGAKLKGSSLSVEGASNAGLLLVGDTRAELTGLSVTRVSSPEGPGRGAAIVLGEGAELILKRASIGTDLSDGIWSGHARAVVEVEDLSLYELSGSGICLAGAFDHTQSSKTPGRLRAARISIEDAKGVMVSEYATMQLEDYLATRVSRALRVSCGASARLERAAIADSTDFAIMVSMLSSKVFDCTPAQTSLMAFDVSVSSNRSVTPEVNAAIVASQGTLALERFRLRDNQPWALEIRSSAKSFVGSEAIIEGSEIAIVSGKPGFDPESALERTWVRNVGKVFSREEQ